MIGAPDRLGRLLGRAVSGSGLMQAGAVFCAWRTSSAHQRRGPSACYQREPLTWPADRWCGQATAYFPPEARAELAAVVRWTTCLPYLLQAHLSGQTIMPPEVGAATAHCLHQRPGNGMPGCETAKVV